MNFELSADWEVWFCTASWISQHLNIFLWYKTHCQDGCRSLSGGVTKNLTLHWMKKKYFFSFYHHQRQSRAVAFQPFITLGGVSWFYPKKYPKNKGLGGKYVPKWAMCKASNFNIARFKMVWNFSWCGHAKLKIDFCHKRLIPRNLLNKKNTENLYTIDALALSTQSDYNTT